MEGQKGGRDDGLERDNDRLVTDPVRSSRDHVVLAAKLEAWLRHKVGDDSAEVLDLSAPSGSGMSSETLLFDARWSHPADGDVTSALVARLAPAPEDVPIFPSYDLDLQFRVLQMVRASSIVPVPVVRWLELDTAAIGAPFFVMDRVEGRVPADIPPYVFEGWLLDADPAQQRRLQDGSVNTLADLHAIDIEPLDTAFLEIDAPGSSPLERHVNHQRWFYDWSRGDRRHPLIEDSFTWLDAHWPDEGPLRISWGDARIGNIMYESGGFDPVAVFDWEMATLAPREVDVGWMVFLHQFFQNIAEMLGCDGLPAFMLADDVVATYEARAGVTLDDIFWFQVYAGLRHAIIMSRIRDRSVAFGEAEWPEDVDEVIPHRDLLRSMIS